MRTSCQCGLRHTLTRCPLGPLSDSCSMWGRTPNDQMRHRVAPLFCTAGIFFDYHSSMSLVTVQDAQDDRESRKDITMTEAQVLVVDDEVGMVTLLRNYLTREGYAVTTAPSAEVALRLLEEHDIAVIMIDLRMP